MTYDVLVIGGGPAGAATAIGAIEAGLSVCVLERSKPPFRKVCGEFLSGPGMEMYQRLTGVSDRSFPRIRTAAFRTRRVFHDGSRHGTDDTEVQGMRRSPSDLRPPDSRPLRLDPHGYGVRRSTLDRDLLNSAAAIGAHVFPGVRAGAATRIGDSWRVPAWPTAAPHEVEIFEAHRLVRATGRVARPAQTRSAWSGRKVPSGGGPLCADVEITFVSGGYYGVAAVDGNMFSKSGLSRVEPCRGNSNIREAGDSATETRGTPAFLLGYQPLSDRGIFQVGDAMATWPPLIGDGITMALHSGYELGRRFRNSRFDAADWCALWNRLFGRSLSRSLSLHGLLEKNLVRRSLLGILDLSPEFGEWLMRQPRFAPRH